MTEHKVEFRYWPPTKAAVFTSAAIVSATLSTWFKWGEPVLTRINDNTAQLYSLQQETNRQNGALVGLQRRIRLSTEKLDKLLLTDIKEFEKENAANDETFKLLFEWVADHRKEFDVLKRQVAEVHVKQFGASSAAMTGPKEKERSGQ